MSIKLRVFINVSLTLFIIEPFNTRLVKRHFSSISPPPTTKRVTHTLHKQATYSLSSNPTNQQLDKYITSFKIKSKRIAIIQFKSRIYFSLPYKNVKKVTKVVILILRVTRNNDDNKKSRRDC